MTWRIPGLLLGIALLFAHRGAAAQNLESSKMSSGVVVQGQVLQSPKLSTGVVTQGAGMQSSKMSPGIVVQDAGLQSSKISVGIVLQLTNPNGIVVRAPLTNW